MKVSFERDRERNIWKKYLQAFYLWYNIINLKSEVEEESWTIVNQLMKLNHKMGNLKYVYGMPSYYILILKNKIISCRTLGHI